MQCIAPNHPNHKTLCHVTQRYYYLVPSLWAPRHCLEVDTIVMTYSLIATHTDAGLERIPRLSLSQSKLANGLTFRNERASDTNYMHNIRGRRSSEGAGNEVCDTEASPSMHFFSLGKCVMCLQCMFSIM